MAEVSVTNTITLRLTASEFRLVCLALDDRALTTEEDEILMEQLAGRLLRGRTTNLNAQLEASVRAEESHDEETKR